MQDSSGITLLLQLLGSGNPLIGGGAIVTALIAFAAILLRLYTYVRKELASSTQILEATTVQTEVISLLREEIHRLSQEVLSLRDQNQKISRDLTECREALRPR